MSKKKSLTLKAIQQSFFEEQQVSQQKVHVHVEKKVRKTAIDELEEKGFTIDDIGLNGKESMGDYIKRIGVNSYSDKNKIWER